MGKVLWCVLFLVPVAEGQLAPAPEGAVLWLRLDAGGREQVQLDLPPGYEGGVSLVELARASGCPLASLVESEVRRRRRLVMGSCTTMPAAGRKHVEWDLERLSVALATQNVKALTVCIAHPDEGSSELEPPLPPDRSGGMVRYCGAYDFERGGTGKLALRYGYRPADLVPALTGCAVALLAALLLQRLARKAALDEAVDPAVRWFRFAQRRTYLWIFLWCGWLMVLGWFDMLPALVSVASGLLPAADRLPWTPLILAIAMFPPWMFSVAAARRAQPVYRRLRGIEITPAALAGMAGWGGAIPASMVIAGYLLADGTTPGAIECGALSMLAVVYCVLRLRTFSATVPFELPAGPLRERILALARAARVKLKRIQVVPANRWKVANAFALRGGRMMLTEPLLEVSSRRELDALCAHEIAHLEYRHPAKMGMFFFLSAQLMFGAAVVMSGIAERLDRPRYLFWLVASLLVAWLALGFLRRRNEFTADARSVSLTGDAEAMIGTLVRLSRVNGVPVEWGGFESLLATHPSTLRRARRMAARAGLPREKLDELLALSGAAADRYEPGDARAKPGPAHGSIWVVFGLVGSCAVLAASISAAALVPPPFTIAAPAAGLALALAVVTSARRFNTGRRAVECGARLHGALAMAGMSPYRWSGQLVAIGIGQETDRRDTGHLLYCGDSLCFFGEQARFRLERESVTAVSRQEPGAIRLEWIHPLTGRAESMTVRPVGTEIEDAGAVLERTYATCAAWKSGADSAGLPPLARELAPPDLESLRAARAAPLPEWRAVRTSGVIALVAAVIFATVFRLQVWPGGAYLAAGTLAVAIVPPIVIRYRARA